MACGGSSAPAQPSTTTQVQDIPAWEQGYVTNLLGQAQTEAAQPYQQFPGQQVAGFTAPQTQAFSNVEGAGATNQAYQNAATGQANQGASTANSIYGAANPLIQSATQQATPQGIQSYLSPYESNVVSGIQNEANQNWNQNILPGINNEFVGSGGFGGGRDAAVTAQNAGNFQTGLSANVANALESGYTTAGQQAATQAGILGNAGNALGNLEATQAGAQLGAANTLGTLGQNAAATNLTQNQALQAVGQEQQGLNQTNLNVAQQNFQNQVQYPEQQTQFLNQIVRGLPAPSATTSGGQVATPSVSPLSGIGAGTVALAGLNTPTGKKGGLVKGYAGGGEVEDNGDDTGSGISPLELALIDSQTGNDAPPSAQMAPLEQMDVSAPPPVASDDSAPPPMQSPLSAISMNNAAQATTPTPLDAINDTSDTKTDDNANPQQYPMLTKGEMQQQQLLALARGMLTPQVGGSVAGGVAQGLGNVSELQQKQQELMMNQSNLAYQRSQDAKKIGIEQQKANQAQEQIEQGRYTPVKDFYGNVTGMVEGKTGKFTPISAPPGAGVNVTSAANEPPSPDPQKAAIQILAEQGTVPTQVGNKFDIAGRNKQVDAYNNAALAAKSTIQQLNKLDAQTGKYTPGKVAGTMYAGAAALGTDPTGGATARTEADKASKNLANSFMQSNVGAKGAGIRMVQFDADAVPNADMPDQARNDLINTNKAIANSQIQRAQISNMYPRMQMSNVNAIMDSFEEKNPPILPTGNANPNWMTYKAWLAAGRPDTSVMPAGNASAPSSTAPASQPSASGVSPALLAAMKKKGIEP